MKNLFKKMAGGHPIPERDAQGLREFGLVTGALIAGIFGLLLPWLFNLAFPYWPWILALLLWLPALLAPTWLHRVYRLWMHFAIVIGYINTRLFLSLFFFLIFSPMGLLMRLFGNDPMRRKLDSTTDTYRIKSTDNPREQMERPF